MNTFTYTAANTKLFTYTGSKAKYQDKFDDLHSQISIKKVDTYIEAFGGTLASMFHNLKHINANRVIINDINPRIINLYKQIENNPQEVIEVFTLLEETFQNHIPARFKRKGIIGDKKLREKYLAHLRDFFNSAREYFNTSDFTTSQNAGTLLFLLNHHYNGIYSEAKKTGYYNNCFNWTMKKINVKDISENIMNLHSFFIENEVVIECLDTFTLIEKYSHNNDTLIYLDPPYQGSKIGYSAEQTTDFNKVEAHLALLKSCEDFDYVMYSNNFNEETNKMLQYNVEFNRTNGTAQNKQKKSKREILGLIDNTYKIMPNIETLLNDLELSKIKIMPTVSNLLRANNCLETVKDLNFSTTPFMEVA